MELYDMCSLWNRMRGYIPRVLLVSHGKRFVGGDEGGVANLCHQQHHQPRHGVAAARFGDGDRARTHDDADDILAHMACPQRSDPPQASTADRSLKAVPPQLCRFPALH